MHYEEIKVDGKILKIWLPKGYLGYMISDDGGWLDGVFDSKESAIEGFRLTLKPDGHALLAEINKRINFITGENRLITMTDLVT